MVGDSAVDAAPALASTRLTPAGQSLARVRDRLDQSIWATEVAAQEHEQTFVVLWDNVRAADDKLAALAEVAGETLVLGQPAQTRELDWGIRHTRFGPQGQDGQAAREIPRAEWTATIEALRQAGWRLEELEFHHSKFDPAADGKPARSIMASVFHLVNESSKARMIVRGDLAIEWTGRRDKAGNPIPARLDATNFQVFERSGTPPFSLLASWPFVTDSTGVSAPSTTHPILVFDLDGDGLSEISVAGFNRLYKNLGQGKFAEPEPLCADQPKHVNGGVLADFNGDRRTDFLAGLKNGYLRLYLGDEQGRFSTAGREIRATDEKLRSPTSLTAGDIDGDGDLDLWVGQYKPPYLDGHMPTPYYDANDGFPSFLLVNDGQGEFTDGTAAAGLDKKRLRRTYSSSLVDLNNDDKLDLLVVSDFSGIDVYYGDGQGKFRDVTDEVTPVKYAFGMSHTFGDYNQDGLLDFYVIGMSSTTARRLEYMNLKRNDFEDRTKARPGMGYGNRMYLSKGGSFEQNPQNDQVARSGWSWGSTTFDPDNDGDQDLFIANGYQSGKSCKDYCTRYWTHDIYTGTSKPDPAIKELFGQSLAGLDKDEESWNGYEHDVLFMNFEGKEFLNVAFLLGVGFEFDSRAVVSDDFDGDGRMDLVVEQFDRASKTYTLHLLRNEWPTDHHWIGVRLRDGGPGRSPMGAKVTLHTPEGKRVAQNVSGHSVWSQHPNTVHWGLGNVTDVEAIEVRWPNGETTRLDKPAVDQYHEAK
jgi:hypothetical protein